jgi:phosphoribosylpyrophosphate synthetase
MKKMPREKWPIQYGRFTDGETMFEGGQRAFKDLIDERHIIFVKHFLSPNATHPVTKRNISVNDNISEMRTVAQVLSQVQAYKIAKPLKFTLAAAYLPYVRSHSIEKYAEQGHMQADMLSLFVKDIANGGINEVIGIDPHSDKIWSELSKYKIFGQSIDPFKDPARKDYRLYGHLVDGLPPEGRAAKMLSLCPFAELYADLAKKHDKISLVEADYGAYDRVLNYSFTSNIRLEDIISFDKIREGEAQSRIAGVRYYSLIQDKADIQGRFFLIPDDMVASGGTMIKVAKFLMENGAIGVCGMASHNTGWMQKELQESPYIQTIYFLDTVSNDSHPKFVYLEKSKDLLAMALYKSHNNLLHSAKL